MQGNSAEPFLHLSHVNVARGDNVVLHDINLSVNAGEHIAILGPEWMREVDADQDDYLRVLSADCSARDEGKDLWARAVGFDGVEEAAGRGFGGVAGEADTADFRARCGDYWVFFEQYAVAESCGDR